MKTFESCCDEVAKKYGTIDWHSVLRQFKDSSLSLGDFKRLLYEAAELYKKS